MTASIPVVAPDDSTWATLLRCVEEEWHIWTRLTYAVGDALFGASEEDRTSN